MCIRDRYYCNIWLASIKYKMEKYKEESRGHSNRAKEILKKKNREAIFKHKAGTFVLRWMGDHISLFLEAALVIDTKPIVQISNVMRKSVSKSNLKSTRMEAVKREIVLGEMKTNLESIEEEKAGSRLQTPTKKPVVSTKITKEKEPTLRQTRKGFNQKTRKIIKQ
eukprot:TRINITY_DN9006_c0_g1_i2.p1 TRINITY_DN9006_c0_g1~~TRINITY_DN9006_c0_g1_i2.p1  ORF type:complete len:166 (+),score=45.88 TRINITY_DN9006_c0_g1_i2:64-561(+)